MRQRGQSALYAVILVPTVLIVILSMVVDVGGARVARARYQSAADLAALAGAGQVDAARLSQSGLLRLDGPSAVDTARTYLRTNLEHLGTLSHAEAASAADQAQISIIDSLPAHDPVLGGDVRLPAVHISLRAPVRTQLLHLCGMPDLFWVNVESSAVMRI